jgi:tetratricopeptide (TPR) repeat protein
MRELRVILAVFVLVALASVFLGCEEEEFEEPPSQADWTRMGWDAWTTGDFDNAIRYFGNAIKVDENYMPAFNGLGWTFMRLQDTATSVNYFEDGVLYGAAYADSDADKRGLYVGLTYALEAADDFGGAIAAGETYLAMDPPPESPGDNRGTWKHPYDERLTAYDAYIILAVCYFAKGYPNKCVDTVHYMQRKINETPEYQFTNWSALAAKIEDMADKDPS